MRNQTQPMPPHRTSRGGRAAASPRARPQRRLGGALLGGHSHRRSHCNDIQIEGRLPDPVQIAAYYAVSEALTNAGKHANATTARIDVAARSLAPGISLPK